MRVVICIKPVIDNYSTQALQLNKKGYAVNPYDQLVLKQLLEIKKKQNFELIGLCMGSMKCQDMLFRLLAGGVDSIILLSDMAFAGADTYATTEVLSKALIRIGNVDYIFCGAKAIDGETGQVPYELAHRLNIPVINNVSNIMSMDGDGLQLERQLDDLVQEEIIASPAVIIGKYFTTEEFTVSLLSLKRAKNKKMIIWNHERLELLPENCGIAGSKTKVKKAREINRFRKGEIMKGELNLVSQEMLKIIKG